MSQNRYLTPLLSVHFVGTLGFSIILPFLVFIVERFQGNSFVYGLLGATYPAFQFIGAPILGKWSDKYGRKRILLLSQLGTLLSWGVFLLGLYMPVEVLVEFDSEWTGTTILTLPIAVLFLARALDGLTGGNISVANAYLSDISTKEDKSRNYGKMSIAANFGFVLGPVLAGLLSATALQETLPVLAAILISTAALVTIFLYLPDVRPCEIEKHDEERIEKVFGQELKDCFQPPADKHALKHLLAIPGIPFLLLVYFAIFLGFNFFYTAFPVHASAGLKWPVTELGIYLSSLSLMMAIVQGPVLKWMTARFSNATLVIVGSILLGFCFLLLTIPDRSLAYAAAVLFALGNGLMWPCYQSILSNQAGEQYQGYVQGLAGSLGSLASITGLVTGGLLYASVGAGTFGVSAVTMFIVALMSVGLIRLTKKVGRMYNE